MTQGIFVSKPNVLTETQEEFWNGLETELQDRNLEIRSIGYSDYSFKTPLQKVREVMQECDGAIILGLQQKRIQHGYDRDGNPISDFHLPTPWNNLEAGMAYMVDLPMLVILESGVTKEGIFDAESSDRYIMESDLDAQWLGTDEFLQPLNEWREEVLLSRSD